MLRQDLEKIADASEVERPLIIQDVLNEAKEHFEEVIAYATGAQKILRQPAIAIIRTVGYPDNKEAIGALVANVGDPNSPGWDLAGDTLCEVAPDIVGMYIVEYMFDCCSHHAWEDIDSICMWLASDDVDRVYAVNVGPCIAYVLSKDFYCGFPLHDPLTVLEKIGPECAIYALPILLELASMHKEDPKDLGERIWNFIGSFEPRQLAPYTRVIQALGEKYLLNS